MPRKQNPTAIHVVESHQKLNYRGFAGPGRPNYRDVLARFYRTKGDIAEFFKYALKITALGGCSEMCCELGQFYYERKDYAEAAMWFYNAANETEALLSLSYKEDIPKNYLEEIENRA